MVDCDWSKMGFVHSQVTCGEIMPVPCCFLSCVICHVSSLHVFTKIVQHKYRLYEIHIWCKCLSCAHILLSNILDVNF